MYSLIQMSCDKGCDVSPAPAQKEMCPTRMSDGRAFTDYRPRCIVNAELLTSVAVKSSYESRMFLQNNADQFMEAERKKAMDRLIPCAPCKRSFDEAGTMLSERYVVRCDAVSCSRTEVDPNGVGDGRA